MTVPKAEQAALPAVPAGIAVKYNDT